MGWKLKLHDRKPDHPEVGDCWYAPYMRGRKYLRQPKPADSGPAMAVEEQEVLSPRYYREHAAQRDPVVVCMPDGRYFCIDGRACDHERDYYGEGWLVQGTLPDITITPSINLVDSYHGWIKNGIITDDCEGRRYDDQGRIINGNSEGKG